MSKTSDCDVLEIAVPSDQNYFPGLLVTVYSVVKYLNPIAAARIHILDGGIEDESYRFMETVVSRFGKDVRLLRHRVVDLDYLAFPSWKGNRMTYVRFVLPTLLEGSDYVIYIDSDMLWLADINQIWEKRDPNIIMKVVHDTFGTSYESPWFKDRGISFYPDKYFNNGLLLINLRLFREENVVAQAIDFLHKHPDVIYADQSVFNALMGARVKLLDPHWNFVARDMPNETVFAPLVIHYVADACPWRSREYCSTVRPYLKIWLDAYVEASGISAREVYKRFGYSYRPIIDSVLMFISKHKWLRRSLTVPLRMIGLARVAHVVNSTSTRCGRISLSML